MLRALLAGWARKKDGTTAVEFSLLCIPYFMLTIGVIELSMMYAAATLLEGATNSAARLIRTGQIQQSGDPDPEQLFRDALCNYATTLINCNDVVIEVVPMASFSDYDSLAPTYDADGNMVSQGFDAGGSEDRMLIRTAYRYEMMNPFTGVLLVGPSNSKLFMSTIVIQTEPYDFDAAQEGS